MKIIVFVIILNIFCIQYISNCSCIILEKDLTKVYTLYTNIFKGTAALVLPPNSEYLIQVMFNKITAFKGNNTESTTYVTNNSAGVCGYHFEVGQTYLVYANEYETGKISISMCSNTKMYSNDTATNLEISELESLSDVKLANGFNLAAKLFVVLSIIAVIIF